MHKGHGGKRNACVRLSAFARWHQQRYRMREGRSYFARLKGGAALRDGVSDTNIVPREGWHRQGRMVQVRFKSSSSFILLTFILQASFAIQR